MKLTSLEIKLLREYALAESSVAYKRHHNMKSRTFAEETGAPVFSEFQIKRMLQTHDFYRSLAGKLDIMYTEEVVNEKVRKAEVTLLTNGRM